MNTQGNLPQTDIHGNPIQGVTTPGLVASNESLAAVHKVTGGDQVGQIRKLVEQYQDLPDPKDEGEAKVLMDAIARLLPDNVARDTTMSLYGLTDKQMDDAGFRSVSVNDDTLNEVIIPALERAEEMSSEVLGTQVQGMLSPRFADGMDANTASLVDSMGLQVTRKVQLEQSIALHADIDNIGLMHVREEALSAYAVLADDNSTVEAQRDALRWLKGAFQESGVTPSNETNELLENPVLVSNRAFVIRETTYLTGMQEGNAENLAATSGRLTAARLEESKVAAGYTHDQKVAGEGVVGSFRDRYANTPEGKQLLQENADELARFDYVNYQLQREADLMFLVSQGGTPEQQAELATIQAWKRANGIEEQWVSNLDPNAPEPSDRQLGVAQQRQELVDAGSQEFKEAQQTYQFGSSLTIRGGGDAGTEVLLEDQNLDFLLVDGSRYQGAVTQAVTDLVDKGLYAEAHRLASAVDAGQIDAGLWDVLAGLGLDMGEYSLSDLQPLQFGQIAPSQVGTAIYQKQIESAGIAQQDGLYDFLTGNSNAFLELHGWGHSGAGMTEYFVTHLKTEIADLMDILAASGNGNNLPTFYRGLDGKVYMEPYTGSYVHQGDVQAALQMRLDAIQDLMDFAEEKGLFASIQANGSENLKEVIDAWRDGSAADYLVQANFAHPGWGVLPQHADAFKLAALGQFEFDPKSLSSMNPYERQVQLQLMADQQGLSMAWDEDLAFIYQDLLADAQRAFEELGIDWTDPDAIDAWVAEQIQNGKFDLLLQDNGQALTTGTMVNYLMHSSDPSLAVYHHMLHVVIPGMEHLSPADKALLMRAANEKYQQALLDYKPQPGLSVFLDNISGDVVAQATGALARQDALADPQKWLSVWGSQMDGMRILAAEFGVTPEVLLNAILQELALSGISGVWVAKEDAPRSDSSATPFLNFLLGRLGNPNVSLEFLKSIQAMSLFTLLSMVGLGSLVLVPHEHKGYEFVLAPGLLESVQVYRQTTEWYLQNCDEHGVFDPRYADPGCERARNLVNLLTDPDNMASQLNNKMPVFLPGAGPGIPELGDGDDPVPTREEGSSGNYTLITTSGSATCGSGGSDGEEDLMSISETNLQDVFYDPLDSSYVGFSANDLKEWRFERKGLPSPCSVPPQAVACETMANGKNPWAFLQYDPSPKFDFDEDRNSRICIDQHACLEAQTFWNDIENVEFFTLKYNWSEGSEVDGDGNKTYYCEYTCSAYDRKLPPADAIHPLTPAVGAQGNNIVAFYGSIDETTHPGAEPANPGPFCLGMEEGNKPSVWHDRTWKPDTAGIYDHEIRVLFDHPDNVTLQEPGEPLVGVKEADEDEQIYIQLIRASVVDPEANPQAP